jgi:hypothetical protein
VSRLIAQHPYRALAAARLKASGMAITGARTKEMIEIWKLIKSLR